jgi:hypothetical protein
MFSFIYWFRLVVFMMIKELYIRHPLVEYYLKTVGD